MTQVIERSVIIEAPPPKVWRALTDSNLIRQWMAEPEIGIEIVTAWKVGSPIVFKGFHHVNFENKGTILRFEPNSLLQYSHLSSLSRLPDKAENYSIIEFRLTPVEDHSSSLTVTISDFPNEVILRHLDFYWRTTSQVLKRSIESSQQATSSE